MDHWQGQSQMLKKVLLRFYNMIPYMGFVGAFKSHLKKNLFKWQFFLMHIAKDRADKSQLTVTAYSNSNCIHCNSFLMCLPLHRCNKQDLEGDALLKPPNSSTIGKTLDGTV